MGHAGCCGDPASLPQFTAKQLEKLAKKAEKDSKSEQAKVKKVSVGPDATGPSCWSCALTLHGVGRGWRLLGSPPLLGDLLAATGYSC